MTFYLLGGQYEHQNQREVLMVEEVYLPLVRRNRLGLVQRQELFVDECRHTENPLEAVVQEAM